MKTQFAKQRWFLPETLPFSPCRDLWLLGYLRVSGKGYNQPD